MTADASLPAAARFRRRVVHRLRHGNGTLLLQVVVLAIVYAAAARLPATLELLNGRSVPAWHPSGIAVAALLVWGSWTWPGILVGAVAANLLDGASPVVSVALGVASTVGPLVGVTLLRRTRFRPQLDRLVNVPLLALASVAAAVAAATLGLAGFVLAEVVPGHLSLHWALWAMGDAASTFVVGGALLAWATPPAPGRGRLPLDSMIAIAATVGVAAILFFDLLDLRGAGESVAFPIVALLVWVAFRAGPRGTALASLGIAVLAIAATDRAVGPFVGTNREASVFYVVVFVGLSAATAAAVAAVMAERQAGVDAVATERRALADRAAMLTRLVAYSSRISGVLSTDALHPLAVDALDAVVTADLVGLTVVDPESGSYVVRAEKGSPGSVGRFIEPGSGPAGRAIRDRRVVRVRPYPRAEFPASIGDANAASGYADAVGLPLVREGKVIGSLTVARVDPAAPFTELELEMLSLLADEITLAIVNAQLHGEVAELAVHDGLTGLHNRRYFDAAFVELLAARARLPGEPPPVSVLLFDLDHFGQFNLAHGHQAGDEALRAFAAILRGRMRAADLVARYGGEEFIAVLVGANRPAAVTVADEVRRLLAQTVVRDIEGEPLAVTVSAGCTTRSDPDVDGSQLIASADAALVMAKRAGRNQVVAA